LRKTLRSATSGLPPLNACSSETLR
jgi:hypothetical protein